MSIFKRPKISRELPGQLYFVFISLMGCITFLLVHQGEFYTTLLHSGYGFTQC